MVPVDGSENCNTALLEAIKIAKITGGKITTLNVYPRWTTNIVDSKDAIPEIMQSEAQTILAQTKKLAAAEGFEVQTLMVDGDAVQQIIKTANEGNFDLIVMGARGKSMLKGLILGSVSTGVLKNTSCPVLITKCRP